MSAPVISNAPFYQSDFEGSQPNIWRGAFGGGAYSPELLPVVEEGGNHFLASTGGWWLDPNHTTPGPGWLYQPLIGSFGLTGFGNEAWADLKNATFSFKVRFENLFLADSRLLFLYAAQDPKIANEDGVIIDYEYSAIEIEDLETTPGEWFDVTIPLKVDAADWTSLTSNPTRASEYSDSASIEDALSALPLHVLIIIQSGQTAPVPPPSGTIYFDDIVFERAPTLSSKFLENAVNASPQWLGYDVIVTDDGANFDGGTLTMSWVGVAASDQLSIRHQGTAAGQIGVSGGNVTFGGVLIGQFAGGFNGSPLTVSFNANATALAVERLIENLAYQNTSDTPVEVRTFTIGLTDSDGEVGSISGEVRVWAQNEPVTGTAGNDVLQGAAGDDLLIGGLGDDQYFVHDNPPKLNFFPDHIYGDRVVELVGEGRDTVFADIDYKLPAGSEIEELRTTNDAGTAPLKLTGNEFSNWIYGNNGGNSLDGGAGADVTWGGAGDDIHWVDNAGDIAIEVSGQGSFDRVFATASWTLTAGSDIENITIIPIDGTEAINLNGNALSQSLLGNFGDNILDGRGGGDVMVGRAGNDTFFVRSAADEVAEAASEGTDRVYAALSWTLQPGVFVEYLNTTSNAGLAPINLTGNAVAQTITGNDGDNVLNGGGGDDVLIGRRGNDTIDGGAGFDTVSFVGATQAVVVDLIANQASGAETGVDQIVNVENVTGGNGDDTILGSNGVNRLEGGWGHDVLDGRGGNDTMLGGLGNDRYFVRHGSDIVTEFAGHGTDTVYAEISWVLTAGSHVEYLSTTSNAGTAAINLTGNAFANNVTGNNGNNTLNGAGGADRLVGRKGDDWYFVDDVWDWIVELPGEGTTDRVFASASYALNGGASIEIISTTDHFATNAINLTGNEFGQIIYGNFGDNVLDGRGGGDVLVGRAGNDTFLIRSDSDRVNEQANEGTDRVYASTSWTLTAGAHVEFLSTTSNAGAATLHLVGNELAQTITGNDGVNWLLGGGGDDTLDGRAGADVIDGGSGADKMYGGVGSDTFYVDNVADLVFENPGQGDLDVVYSSVDYTAPANTEHLGLIGNAIRGTGHSGADIVVGNAQNNILNGKGGHDTLAGGAGADTYVFDLLVNGIDVVLTYDWTQDIFQFTTALYADLADLLAHATQVGNDVVITHDANNVISVLNTQLANFDDGTFVFV